MTISLEDKRTDEKEEFHYENGVQDFVSYLNEDKDSLTPVLYFEGKQDGFEVEVALQYNDGYSETFFHSSIMSEQKMAERTKQV